MKYLFLLGLCAVLACSAHAAAARLSQVDPEQLDICPLEATDPNLRGMFDEYPENFKQDIERAMSAASESDLAAMAADEKTLSREARQAVLDSPTHFKPFGRYYDMCPEKVQYIKKYGKCWILPGQNIRYVTCSRYCRFFKHMPCKGHCGSHLAPFWPTYRCLAERWYRQYAWAACPQKTFPFWAIKRISVWSPQACCCHMWFPWFQKDLTADYEAGMASKNVAESCPNYERIDF